MAAIEEHQIRIDDYLPYTAPFLIFAGFTYLVPLFNISDALVYPAKILSVMVMLVYFWPAFKNEIRLVMDMNAIMAAILIFLLWVALENRYPLMGTPVGFNPHHAAQGNWVVALMVIRLFGATLVIPVMAELFWRSFALRFLMDRAFKQVPLGSFSWFSFVFVSIAFGLEYHRWLQGILTGMILAILLYQRKNLFSSILAHSLANFFLGVYVIVNQKWSLW